MDDLRHGRLTPWVQRYKWPIYFFVAVAFWNMVGAGLFGFMINPPIALYYMQGLNTTPLHGHAALFGVYGMLGIGLMLFCLRAMEPRPRVEGRAAQVRLLVDQRRPDGDVRRQPAAGRPDADLGLGGTRLLVRPQHRVPRTARTCRLCAGCASRATRCSPSARWSWWPSSSPAVRAPLHAPKRKSPARSAFRPATSLRAMDPASASHYFAFRGTSRTAKCVTCEIK